MMSQAALTQNILNLLEDDLDAAVEAHNQAVSPQEIFQAQERLQGILLQAKELENEADKKGEVDLKRAYGKCRMDAAYYCGANFLLQKKYHLAHRLFYEAYLCASFTVRDPVMVAVAGLYLGISTKAIFETDFSIKAEEDNKAVLKAETYLYQAIKNLEALVKAGAVDFNEQLALGILHLVSLAQGKPIQGYREWLNLALQIFEGLGKEEELGLTYRQSAVMYTKAKKDELAHAHFKNALTYFKELDLKKEFAYAFQEDMLCQNRLGLQSLQKGLADSIMHFELALKESNLSPHERAVLLANQINLEIYAMLALELPIEQYKFKLIGIIYDINNTRETLEDLDYLLADIILYHEDASFRTACTKILSTFRQLTKDLGLKHAAPPTPLERLSAIPAAISAFMNIHDTFKAISPRLNANSKEEVLTTKDAAAPAKELLNKKYNYPRSKRTFQFANEPSKKNKNQTNSSSTLKSGSEKMTAQKRF